MVIHGDPWGSMVTSVSNLPNLPNLPLFEPHQRGLAPNNGPRKFRGALHPRGSGVAEVIPPESRLKAMRWLLQTLEERNGSGFEWFVKMAVPPKSKWLWGQP